ncbi:MAG TPA: right-handed parallel beta-helix repeat-containing protein [Kofleriaceae bacterium]
MALPRTVGFTLLLAACGRSGFAPVPDGSSSDDGSAPALTVEPLYAAAPGFTDWVENDGATRLTPTGVACNGDLVVDGGPRSGAELGRDACVHAGLMRAVVIANSSCDDVTATDTLGALEWACRVRDADAVVYSTSLRAGVSLRDLLDATGWKANTLEVRRGDTPIAHSDGAAFWPNAVVSLDDTVASGVNLVLSDASTIYTLGVDRALPAITLDAPGAAFVTLGASTLSPASASNGCQSAGTAFDTACAIATTPAARFAMISASVAPTVVGILAVDPTFVTVTSSTVTGGTQAASFTDGIASEVSATRIVGSSNGVQFTNGAYHAARGVDMTGDRSGAGVSFVGGRRHAVAHATIVGEQYGVISQGSADARMHALDVVNSGLYGVYVDGATGAVLTDIIATDNGFDAIRLINGANDTTIVGVLAANNGGEGVNVWGVLRPTVSHVTAIGAFQFGVTIYLGSNYASVSQINAVNSGDYGLFVRGSNYGLFSQIAVTNNAYQQSRIYQNSDFNTFLHAYVGGPGTVCLVDGGGVANNTIVSDGVPGICGGDNATYDFRSAGALTQATTFGGQVLVDGTNADAASFAAGVLPTAITDWTHFDSKYRYWGNGASTSFLDASNRLNCVAPTVCRVWDASLQPTSALYNTSGTGRTQNEPFVSGATCPSAVQGDLTMHDLRGAEIVGDGIGDDDGVCEVFEKCDAQSVYLVNAREIIEDDIGDDDGLCESGEACTYSPHFGYYQELAGVAPGSQCTFVDGSGPFGVTGVTMYSL